MAFFLFLFKDLTFFYWIDEYFFFTHYFFVIIFFISFLWFLVLNLSFSITLFEKTSQYECGFEPFGFNAVFDLQYFLIGILYLIFDVELVLILPWILGFSVISWRGLFYMFLFLLLFILGLIYEWKKNVLHWT